MNRLVALFIGIIISTGTVQAQHTVDINITVLPEQHQSETLYVTGIFNRWAPGDQNYTLTKVSEGKYKVHIKEVPKGLFEYKFTRGNWTTLEATTDGRLVAPRNAIISKDTVIDCVIPAWRDDFPASTASAQVKLLDSAFFVPQLNTYKRIWIYLPKDYSAGKKKYPVLYMHDGQDVFDEETSNGRLGPLEWGVDEVMDQSKNPCIVVAIEHHPDKDGRQKEYYIHPNKDFPEVYGKEYLEFIVKTLKPFIDKQYRTLPGKKTTWMAGGSMGGLITLYAGMLYPDVFGGLGVMSPSIWQDEGNTFQHIEQLKSIKPIQQQHYYFYAGDNENRIKPDGSRVQMHIDVKAAVEQLKAKTNTDINMVIYPTGRHGAWYWRLAFPAIYEWLSSKQ